jgi:hypothetical protein
VFARLIERVHLIRHRRRAAVLDAPDFEVRPDGPGRQGINRRLHRNDGRRTAEAGAGRTL